MSNAKCAAWGKVALYGIPAVLLYAGLFWFEKPILEASRQGRWYFVVPIAIAFVMSYFHGGFTASFWDALGVKAKK